MIFGQNKLIYLFLSLCLIVLSFSIGGAVRASFSTSGYVPHFGDLYAPVNFSFSLGVTQGDYYYLVFDTPTEISAYKERLTDLSIGWNTINKDISLPPNEYNVVTLWECNELDCTEAFHSEILESGTPKFTVLSDTTDYAAEAGAALTKSGEAILNNFYVNFGIIVTIVMTVIFLLWLANLINKIR